MRRSIVPVTLCAALALGSATLPGCSRGVHGVEISNQTDRIVRIELIQLKKDGEMNVFSTQTLGPGGDFKNKVDVEERRAGTRVRMMLADQGVENANWIMLNLPSDRDRAYELVLVNNRLSAKELTKNRKLKNPD